MTAARLALRPIVASIDPHASWGPRIEGGGEARGGDAAAAAAVRKDALRAVGAIIGGVVGGSSGLLFGLLGWYAYKTKKAAAAGKVDA